MAVGGEERLERSRGVGGVLGFPTAAQASYRPAWAVAFILGVEETVVDRVPGSVPPSCFSARGRRRRTGTGLVHWWAGKWVGSVG
jgi:hypothetical protein